MGQVMLKIVLNKKLGVCSYKEHTFSDLKKERIPAIFIFKIKDFL